MFTSTRARRSTNVLAARSLRCARRSLVGAKPTVPGSAGGANARVTQTVLAESDSCSTPQRVESVLTICNPRLLGPSGLGVGNHWRAGTEIGDLNADLLPAPTDGEVKSGHRVLDGVGGGQL